MKQALGTQQDGTGNEIACDGKMPKLLNKYFPTINLELVHPNQFEKLLTFADLRTLQIKS